MCRFLIFAGTLEGRRVAEYLNGRKLSARVCVATEYGESLLPRGEYLRISHERLDQEQMEALMEDMKRWEPDTLVIDATHPYAVAVTENIRRACRKTGLPRLRLIRQESDWKDGEAVWVKSTEEAVEYLKNTEGGILVTTGSKELAAFTGIPDYRSRVYARVLSIPKVVRECAQLGFEGKHLICMQGPFSRELNAAMIRQLQTRWLVTKESGSTGGFLEKCLAARDTGSRLVIIGRPAKEEGVTLQECLEILRERTETSGCGRGSQGETSGCKESQGRISGSMESRRETPDGQEGFRTAPSDSRHTDAESKIPSGTRIALVGIGMGTEDTLTVEGKRALEEAQLLIGARRMLEGIARPDQAVFYAYRPLEIRDYIAAHPQYRKVAVALSGDVGFYSGARGLLEVLGDGVQVCCGISSMIYFCGRLQTPWEDAVPVSVHGRRTNIPGFVKENRKVFAIVGSAGGAGEICRQLTDYGMGEIRVAVGERLSYLDEKISHGTAADLADCVTDPLSVMLLENPRAKDHVVTHGIGDGEFLRDKVPMTKEEVRSVSLSKLRLTRDAVVYDVGAGTGSVAVEMARMAVEGRVYAIEKKPEAVELIRRNRQKFAVPNLEVAEGLAPEACRDLPAPTHAFIGGSSGNLREILELLLEKNPHIRIVINCITLETVAEALSCISQLPVEDVDIAQITVAKGKKAGSYHLMMGQNPVSVISFTGRGTEDAEAAQPGGQTALL